MEIPDDLRTWQEVVGYLMSGEPVAFSKDRHIKATLKYGIKSIGEWILRGCHRM